MKMANIVIIAVLVLVLVLVFYFKTDNYRGDINCIASLVQHYNGEDINLSLNYIFNEKNGVVNVTGNSQSKPQKSINRKISFTIHRNGNIYYLLSRENFKLPGDNSDDEWLSMYEPVFFVYPNKSIYMSIDKQKNKNYLFMIDAIPTYICKNQE